MALQFGMIMMFACAFPLAFCLAALHNITEIITDALKLLAMLKRPIPHASATIRAWLNIFQGAFTGVCLAQHVPSYKNNIDKFKAKGADSVICVAVNDPYVMNGWAEKLQAKEVAFSFLYLAIEGLFWYMDQLETLGVFKDFSLFLGWMEIVVCVLSLWRLICITVNMKVFRLWLYLILMVALAGFIIILLWFCLSHNMSISRTSETAWLF